jgi:hypothetical protein
MSSKPVAFSRIEGPPKQRKRRRFPLACPAPAQPTQKAARIPAAFRNMIMPIDE